MKLQKKEEKQEFQKKQGNREQNIWKIIAIVVIMVFGLFILVGFIKAHYIRSLFVKPTDAQTEYAIKVATEKLQSIEGDISAFQVKVWDRMPRRPDDGNARTILQISFYNDTMTHTFLVDVNSGKVIMHSETEVYEKIQRMNSNDWLDHPRGEIYPAR